MDTRARSDDTWDWTEAVRVCTRQARAVLADAAAADDAAQEALLRAWRHRRQCREPDDPLPWMARIARREALREAGRRSWEPLDEAESAGPQPDEPPPLREALATLGPVDRSLLFERYVLERPSDELAERYGVSHGAVRVRLHRSCGKLRRALAEG